MLSIISPPIYICWFNFLPLFYHYFDEYQVILSSGKIVNSLFGFINILTKTDLSRSKQSKTTNMAWEEHLLHTRVAELETRKQSPDY